MTPTVHAGPYPHADAASGAATFAFILLKRLMLYPPEKPGTILDTDWLYRKVGYGTVRWIDAVWAIGPARPVSSGACGTHL